MTAGLVVSILGTRLIEGGSDGLVALGLLPVVWVAVLTTAGELISFASPVMASFFARFSPAGVLIASDLLEAVVSAVAFIIILVAPSLLVPVLIVYLLISVVFPAITDVVEEFYGQQLAQADPDEAMTFNASIYSILAFIGIVFAMPLGSVLAGVSIHVLLAANMTLSAAGTLLRFVSSRTVITLPPVEQDAEDFAVFGKRMAFKPFMKDLVTTGVASPLFSFLTATGATVGGIYVYLAGAASSDMPPTDALGLTVAAFGVGATIGPWIAKALSKLGDLSRTVSRLLWMTIVFLLALSIAFATAKGQISWWIGIVYALFIGLLARMRAVLTTTLRQRSFRGSRFGRIMSWSFAATALGTSVGSWLAIVVNATQFPQVAVFIYALFLVAAALLAMQTHKNTDCYDAAGRKI